MRKRVFLWVLLGVFSQVSLVDAQVVGDRTQFIGCSDGQREGFINEETFPLIAGCSGAWRVAGMSLDSGARMPERCEDHGGDDAAQTTDGVWFGKTLNCGVEDLCTTGWHVCMNEQDVIDRLPAPSACGVTPVGNGINASDTVMFFATRQSGQGYGQCTQIDTDGDGRKESIGADDVFGCGNLGSASDPATCKALSRTAANGCAGVGEPWSCGNGAVGVPNELLIITKTRNQRGGVMCCMDDGFTPQVLGLPPPEPVYTSIGGGECSLHRSNTSTAKSAWLLISMALMLVVSRRYRKG